MLSDSAVRLAFWIGAVSILMTLVLLVQIVWARIELLTKRFIRRRFLLRWQPVLIGTIAGDNIEIPDLRPDELTEFLLLWVRLHKTVYGNAGERLNHMLAKLGLEPEVLKGIQKGSLDTRLVCMTVAGYFGSREALPELKEALKDASSVVSITAAYALIRIDVDLAAKEVIPLIIQRRDWTVDRTAILLQESDQKIVDAFIASVEQAEQQGKPYLTRLMRILDVLQVSKPLPFVRHILEYSDNVELVSTALKLVRSPNDLDLVRKRANDPNWSIQVQAATVLGRLGSTEDVSLLVSLLSSKEWWVRYRSAKSLLQLPFLTVQDVEALRFSMDDNYAIDILSQTLAEQAAR